jgi:hypothetical protein
VPGSWLWTGRASPSSSGFGCVRGDIPICSGRMQNKIHLVLAISRPEIDGGKEECIVHIAGNDLVR